MKAKVMAGMIIAGLVWGMDWSVYEVTVVSKTNRNYRPLVILQDKKGFVFSVEDEDTISEEQVKSLLEIKDYVSRWSRVAVESLVFVPVDTGWDVLLFPRAVMYKGNNLASYLPAGMRFLWRGSLVYDFRMLVATNLLRIRGSYENEEELLSHMNRAVQYPLLYMRSDDMDIVLQKLETVEERSILLQAENEALKKLWLAYLNRNFFGQLRPIKNELIERVVKLKEEYPYWGRRDIYEKVRQEGLKVSQKEVDLILLVYFSQY